MAEGCSRADAACSRRLIPTPGTGLDSGNQTGFPRNPQQPASEEELSPFERIGGTAEGFVAVRVVRALGSKAVARGSGTCGVVERNTDLNGADDRFRLLRGAAPCNGQQWGKEDGS